jgi:glutathione peroxidase
MVKRPLIIILAILAAWSGAAAETKMSAYDFEFTAIEGDPLPLSNLRGKVILVVNTASFCGFTRQYADLQSVWERYRDRGLVVLGVPSSDEAHPFYKWAADQVGPAGAPRWNFHKYLIGPEGDLANWFSTPTVPTSGKISGAIEAQLSRANQPAGK